VIATVAGVALPFATAYTVVDLCPATAMAFPGNANGVLPSGQCVLFGVPSAAFRFTTASQVLASFTVTSSLADLGFEVTEDPPASNVSVGATQSPSTATWLLPAGTFQFHVGSMAAGAFSVAGVVAPPAAGCAAVLLAAPGTFTGQTLAPTDCDFGDGSVFDEYIIASTLPCTITLHSTEFDAYLLALDLTDPDHLGSVVNVQNDNYQQGSLDAKVTLPVCTAPTAPLAILANTYAGQTGAYVLTVALGAGAAVRADSPDAAAFMKRVRVPLGGLSRLLLQKTGRGAKHQ
jgi:hypothetical protein